MAIYPRPAFGRLLGASGRVLRPAYPYSRNLSSER